MQKFVSSIYRCYQKKYILGVVVERTAPNGVSFNTGEESSVTDDMISEHIELISLHEHLTKEQKDHVLNMMRLFGVNK